MWFVIGGLPQTAALQKMMTEPVAWKAVIALSLIAQAWLAWRTLQGLRALPRLLRLPVGDDAALFALRVACGVGAISLGGHALMRALSGFSPNSSMLSFFNAPEAYASATPATTLQLANGAAGAVPPDDGLPQQAGAVVAGFRVRAAAGAGAGSLGAAAVPVGTVALGGLAAGAAVIGGAMAIDHARDLDEQTDPDEVSPLGGVPAQDRGKPDAGTGDQSGVPQTAQDTATWIDENGGNADAPSRPGYSGGGTFANDGRGDGEVLPQTDAEGNPITYREWDINPHTPGVNRGPERLVTGSDGSKWYTGDHYGTFSPLGTKPIK
jgi:guanyl-specific ribonuclease Sa